MVQGMLLEYLTAITLSRLQKPAGTTLVSVGKSVQIVGKTIEDVGHELVRTAPEYRPSSFHHPQDYPFKSAT